LTKRSRQKSVIKEKSRCTQRRYDMNGKSQIQGEWTLNRVYGGGGVGAGKGGRPAKQIN
jgi:hypothetical protein